MMATPTSAVVDIRSSAVPIQTTRPSNPVVLMQIGKSFDSERPFDQKNKLTEDLLLSGEDCPAGKKSVLTKYDKCWSKGQKYCCPTDTELGSCHWRGGSGGNDCANAACNATEVQIDLATYGDQSSACDCMIMALNNCARWYS